jgi:HPt (histidine-containing phosphotransfer) domain-containing protein
VTGDDAPVLDSAVLAELRESTGDDDEFLLELVEAFVAEGQGDLDAMIAAVASGDTAAIVRPAHTLKSSSASLGAMRLAAISRRIEEAGREGRGADLAGDAELARTTWTSTLAALAAAGLMP